MVCSVRGYVISHGLYCDGKGDRGAMGASPKVRLT